MEINGHATDLAAGVGRVAPTAKARLLRRNCELPPIPAVAVNLLGLLAQEEVSLADVARAVSADATIAAMEKLGARRDRIQVAVGPCIGPASYEVGPEFPSPFLEQEKDNAAFFREAKRAGHFMFDLPGYVAGALRAANIETIAVLAMDTCSDEKNFFSYRRTTLRQEPDYGRQISAIMLRD